jgi:hypothetical protein
VDLDDRSVWTETTELATFAVGIPASEPAEPVDPPPTDDGEDDGDQPEDVAGAGPDDDEEDDAPPAPRGCSWGVLPVVPFTMIGLALLPRRRRR